MSENKDELMAAFRKMMKDSGRIARRSPIFKKDIIDFDGIVKIGWKICRIYGYQIFEEDNYTYKIGEKLEDVDILIRTSQRDLAIRFLNGDDMGFAYAPRRDYKGRFKIDYVSGHKIVDIETGEKRKQRISHRFLAARALTDKFTHPYNLLKLPPFQRGIKMGSIGKNKQYGAYIPINQSIGTYENKVIPYKVFEHFIEKSRHIILINTCGCRSFHECKNHDHSIGCIYIGDETIPLLDTIEYKSKIIEHKGWSATKEEALDRVRRAIDDGLIPLLGRSVHEAGSYGIEDKGHFLSCCFCCSCCCVNGRTMMQGPNFNMSQFARMEGVSINVDESKCIGCGECVKVCVFRGRELVDGKAKVDQERCLGCGRCADVCPTGATTINIDDLTRVDEIISKIEEYVDVSPQSTSEE